MSNTVGNGASIFACSLAACSTGRGMQTNSVWNAIKAPWRRRPRGSNRIPLAGLLATLRPESAPV